MKFYFIGLLKTLKSSIVSAFSILCAFLAPIGDLLFFISILVLMDFITGVMASRKRNEVTSSNKMFNSLIKLICYFGILIIGIVFDEFAVKIFKTQLFDHLFSFFLSEESIETLFKFKLAAVGAFIIVVREFQSIDENWLVIRGWSFINTGKQLFDKFTKLTKFLLTLKDKFKK